MAWYHEMFSSLGALVGRHRQEREMDEEVRFHIEMETRRNVEAGLPEREARHRAMRDFGGVERHKDGMRDERGTSWLYDGWNDVRFAARSLRRRAGFTAIATITLALGIGATTTLFGVVKQVLLTPLPYGNPDGIAVVWSAWKGFDQTWLSYDEWEGWKARIPAFADIGLYTDGSVTFDGDSPERIRSANVHANVFPILGVKPIFGRNFTAEEDRPNGPNVVIIGYGLWQRRFGADPAVIGRKVQISGQTSTVVGVMPNGFRFFTPVQVWAPIRFGTADRNWPGRFLRVIARLKPGVSVQRADGEMHMLGQRRAIEVPQFGANWTSNAQPLRENLTGDVRTGLLVLLGAVGFLLVIACANVANLMLARAGARQKEIAIRASLGATRSRIIGQLLTESLVLSLVASLLGLLLAALGTRAIVAFIPRSYPAQSITQVSIDGACSSSR